MDFKTLQEKIAEQQLGGARITDIKLGTYKLVLPEKEDGVIYLSNDKKAKYAITTRGLASMRIVADASKITVKTTSDARNLPDVFSNLQTAIVNDGVAISEATKFNVVGQLRVHDATDTPVYRNQHYKGYADFLKSSRKAFNMPNVTPNEQSARTAAFTDANDALRASGVNSGAKAPKDVDESYICMPVFTISN
jgi:hypothetical protein